MGGTDRRGEPGIRRGTMMKKIRNKKNQILIICCALLLVLTALLYSDSYQSLPVFQKKELTIGVFSDSYWEVQNGYSYQILEDAIQCFEQEHPGANVEYVSGILKSDYSEWLSKQLISGNAPDVIFVLAEDFNDLAEIGALKDLSSFIEKDKNFDEGAFYASAYEYGQHEGKQYSLPYECAPKLMFVNKTILDAEGIAIPDDSWTWDEFYEICREVTKDTDRDGTVDQFGAVGYTWMDAFESNGIRLFNEKGTECDFADKNVEEALEFMERLYGLNGNYSPSTRDFDMGKVVFQPMSFSNYRAYKPYPLSVKKYSGFEWECIPMPAGPEGDNISTLDTLLVAMNENTKCPETAWDFIKVLTSNTEIQSEIFDYSDGVSVLKEVTESDQTLQQLIESSGESGGMNLAVLSDAVENAVIAPGFRGYDEAVAEVDKAVDSILTDSSNIRMDLIIWNRTINQYLKNRK